MNLRDISLSGCDFKHRADIAMPLLMLVAMTSVLSATPGDQLSQICGKTGHGLGLVEASVNPRAT
jgi:hypothetical protein